MATWLSSQILPVPRLLGNLSAFLTLWLSHKVSLRFLHMGNQLSMVSCSPAFQRQAKACSSLCFHGKPEIRVGCCLGNCIGHADSGSPAASALHTCSAPGGSEPSPGYQLWQNPGDYFGSCLKLPCWCWGGLGAQCMLRTPDVHVIAKGDMERERP